MYLGWCHLIGNPGGNCLYGRSIEGLMVFIGKRGLIISSAQSLLGEERRARKQTLIQLEF
jgi:hypothetical protein